MAQLKLNREMANLGVTFIDIDINEGYETWSKLKVKSALHEAGENTLLPLQTISSEHGEKALTGATTKSGLPSLTKNNSTHT